LSLAALAAVVFALGALQYRWIDQVSAAQEARAESHVRETLSRVTDAFDVEITRAVLLFTMPLMPGESTWNKLDEAWAIWNHDAPWPAIMSGLWYLESDAHGWHPHSWGAAGTLDQHSILQGNDLVPGGTPGDVVHLEVRGRTLFLEGRPCMLLPLPSPSLPPDSQRMDRVLVCYDLRYLRDTFLPQLLEKHSTVEDRTEFLFQLEPHGPADAGAMMTVDQLHFRGDCLLPTFGFGPSLSVGGLERDAGSPTGGRQMSTRHGGGGDAWSSSLLRAEGACQGAPRADSGLLQIAVRRPPRTPRDLFTGFRQRNLFASAVVMLALLAALIALVVSVERARRLAHLQTVIAAGISHELRSPLASLNVAADHLKHGHVENAEGARRYGEIIEAQSRRLSHIVDQALALATLRPSNGTSKTRVVSVVEIIRSACDALAPQTAQAGIEVERCVPSDALLAYADSDALLGCLTNLLENAIKYAASGGWIQVSAQRASHLGRPTIVVTIEDRGPGIEDDEVRAVFEPFFRGSSARHSRQPGSGLGLSIVKSAVEAQGGSITLERAVPHGCRFRLFLPMAAV
jgi:signal transduction histidine kinase